MVEVLEHIWQYLVVFFISAMPVVELRGSIPLASLWYNMPLWESFPIAVLGNMLPVPFVLILFKFLVQKFQKVKFIGPILIWLHEKANKKSTKVGGKFKFVALAVFVAIPLPGTGAWTSSMIASVLGLRIKHSIIAIFVGVVACAVIMAVFSYGLLNFVINMF